MKEQTVKSTFYSDLLKAQKQIESVSKDGINPYYRSDYTSLNATIEACKKALNDNNIIVLQPIESDENGVYVCTTLIHTSGESISSKMHIREAKANDPQAQGSAITYARRYSLKSMLCMTDTDDDAEKAQQTYRKKVANPTDQQKKLLVSLCRKTKTDQSAVWEYLGLKEGTKLTKEQTSKAIDWLHARGEVK